MSGELCKSCVHTEVCMLDKNLLGDVFVMGHPLFFDNRELRKKYEERKAKGFPCKHYMPCVPVITEADDVVHCKDCEYMVHSYYMTDNEKVDVYTCINMERSMELDDFCSIGVRRTEDEG